VGGEKLEVVIVLKRTTNNTVALRSARDSKVERSSKAGRSLEEVVFG